MRSRMKWKALRLCRFKIIVGIDLSDDGLCIDTSYVTRYGVRIMHTKLCKAVCYECFKQNS